MLLVKITESCLIYADTAFSRRFTERLISVFVSFLSFLSFSFFFLFFFSFTERLIPKRDRLVRTIFTNNLL